jgi:hypothetical protein
MDFDFTLGAGVQSTALLVMSALGLHDSELHSGLTGRSAATIENCNEK